MIGGRVFGFPAVVKEVADIGHEERFTVEKIWD